MTTIRGALLRCLATVRQQSPLFSQLRCKSYCHRALSHYMAPTKLPRSRNRRSSCSDCKLAAYACTFLQLQNSADHAWAGKHVLWPCVPAHMSIQCLYAGFGTKLSSAGLVYKHYGREIIAKMIGKPQTDPDVETIYLAVYKNFVEAVDAVDNGVHSPS